MQDIIPKELCNRGDDGYVSVGTISNVEFVERLRRKFVDEASKLYGFKGITGVVNVTDIFEENGTSYYVMDYIEGQNLNALVKT